MRGLLFFKPTAKHLVLCVILSLLWVVTNCTTTSQPSTKTQSTRVQSFTSREATTATTATVTTATTTTTTTTTTTQPPPPPDVSNVTWVTQNETSITLQWNVVDNITTYKLQYDQGGEKITGDPGSTVIKTVVSNLTNGTKYNFTLFTLSNGLMSAGFNFIAVTAPPNPAEFESVGQNETSITLKWTRVNGIHNYTLSTNGSETDLTSTDERVSVSGLTDASLYSFTLFTVFHYARSSGKQLNAVTAPQNPAEFKSVGQNETSITLEWTRVNRIHNYTLSTNGSETNLTSTDERVSVSGLTDASLYSFTLFTVFHYARSSGKQLNAVTAPQNPAEFKSVGQNETSITLEWTRVNRIHNYTLSTNGSGTNFSSTDERVSVSGLTDASLYSFTLFTVFHYARSSGKQLKAVTAPRNPEGFKSAGQNKTSITLTWKKVDGIHNYTLIILNGELTTNFSISDEIQTYTVPNLTTATQYHFSLFAVFEYAKSSGTVITAATAPNKANKKVKLKKLVQAPPVVSFVNVTERLATEATLKWGNLNPFWKYKVETNATDKPIFLNDTPNPSTLVLPVKDLSPGTLYSFSVTTLFSGVPSTPFNGIIVTKIDCDKITWHVTNSSIKGTVDGSFSTATASNSTEGHVSPTGRNVSFTGLYPGATYSISLVYKIHNSNLTQCVRDPSVTIIPPLLNGFCKNWDSGYSALIDWHPPNGVFTSVYIRMANKSVVADVKDNQHVIKGLQPAKTYTVSLVSISGERSSQPSFFYCSTDNRGVIAGSVIGVLLFAVLVCVAVFILLKRPDYISRKMPLTAGSKKLSTKGKAISAAKFPAHFHQLSLDENRGFSQEYEDLAPVGTDQTHKAAVLPENKAKNRFTNILPYDWCRVKLCTSSPGDTLDYINASYMPGYNRNREYIASQGPLPSTVKDFWQMIWEQKVKGIVMVTNCTEAGRTKCEQYWPEDQSPRLYGEMLVTLTSEQTEPSWTLRDFRVKNRNNSEERTVKHFHFTAWPDHGVPQGTEVLIQFRALLRRHIEHEGTGEPTVVHCSAGVGRTGTLIALDVLLQQLDKERAVGINDFVRRMRQHRSHMVQTESQYVFLHQCIMDSLKPAEKQEENIYENMIYANATALQEFQNYST